MTKKLLTTLCIIHQHPSVLLGMKKQGFGTGRWNGFGGKVSTGESLEEAAARELEEEAGIKVTELEKIGMLDFSFTYNSEVIQVHIFRATNFYGQPRESEEMRPRWFNTDSIPFQKMWPDDIYWMPLFLKRQPFKGNFHFGKGDCILHQNLTELDDINALNILEPRRKD